MTCPVQQPRTDPVCPALAKQMPTKLYVCCMPLITPSSFDLIDLQPIEFFARAHNTFAAFRGTILSIDTQQRSSHIAAGLAASIAIDARAHPSVLFEEKAPVRRYFRSSRA